MERERGIVSVLVISLLVLVILSIGVGYYLLNRNAYKSITETGEEIVYPSDDQPPYIKNRLVVAFKQGAVETRVQEIVGEFTEFNAKAKLFDEDLNWYYVDFDMEQEINYPNVISKLQAYPEVELVSKSTLISYD